MRLLISELTSLMPILLRVRWLNTGAPALHAIADHFGANMIAADGTLQRRACASGSSPTRKRKTGFNALLHPADSARDATPDQQAASMYCGLCHCVVENSLYKKANRVLVVDVSPETQLKRTMQRDDVTRRTCRTNPCCSGNARSPPCRGR